MTLLCGMKIVKVWYRYKFPNHKITTLDYVSPVASPTLHDGT